MLVDDGLEHLRVRQAYVTFQAFIEDIPLLELALKGAAAVAEIARILEIAAAAARAP